MFTGRTDAKAETPILWPPHVKNWLIGKDPDAGRDWGQEKGTTEDEMAGWHHQLDGHELEWTPGVGDGQGGLACCDSWGCRVGHDWATELKIWKKTADLILPSEKAFRCLYIVTYRPTYCIHKLFLKWYMKNLICCLQRREKVGWSSRLLSRHLSAYPFSTAFFFNGIYWRLSNKL